jgi:hypothetical protein
MNLLLTIEKGPSQGETFALGEGECLVGRSRLANLSINDLHVSRQHLRIVRRGNRIEAENLSRFGTSVDGIRLAESASTMVRPGQRIKLCPTTVLRVDAVEEDAPQVTAPRVAPPTAEMPPQPPPLPPQAKAEAFPSFHLPPSEVVAVAPRAVAEPSRAHAEGCVHTPVAAPVAPPKKAEAAKRPAAERPTPNATRRGTHPALIHAAALVAVAVVCGLTRTIPADAWLRQFLMERSAVQWFTLYGFFLGLGLLVQRVVAHIAASRGMAEQVKHGVDDACSQLVRRFETHLGGLGDRAVAIEKAGDGLIERFDQHLRAAADGSIQVVRDAVAAAGAQAVRAMGEGAEGLCRRVEATLKQPRRFRIVEEGSVAEVGEPR